MATFQETLSWRRDLPHLQTSGKIYFITFCTAGRKPLADCDRDEVLAVCVWAHQRQYWLIQVTVMPDHVHLLLTPYEQFTLPRIMQRIKSFSAHRIGRGVLWQREYFDRILRSDEDVQQKAEYIAENPVRAGLMHSARDYPWTWNVWRDSVAPAASPAVGDQPKNEKTTGEAAGAPPFARGATLRRR